MYPDELAQLRALFREMPFGPDILNLLLAQIASTTANCNRNPKRQPTPFKPTDFLVSIKGTKKHKRHQKLSEEELKLKSDAAMWALREHFGGKYKKVGNGNGS